MKEPLFSIFMPVYNSESTLRVAIESVLSQTCSNWELIIIDDCSTDSSLDIAHEYEKEYNSIHVLSMLKNSRNPRMPRELGMSVAKGEYFIFLDSDDTLDPNYLKDMSYQSSLPEVDVILPIMVLVSSTSHTWIGTVPSKVLEKDVYTGEEACKMTIPRYSIGCGGMAFKSTLYSYVKEENDCEGSFSDEIAERIILLHARKVSQSSAKYFYVYNDQSVSHKRTVKYYQFLIADQYLLEFCKQHFDLETHSKMANSVLSHLISFYKDYIKHKCDLSIEEQYQIEKIFSSSYTIVRKEPRKIFSVKKRMFLLNITIFHVLCRVLLFFK